MSRSEKKKLKVEPMEFRRLIEDAGFEVRSYSGRGMFGASCLGFVVERLDALLGAGAVIAAKAFWDIEEPEEVVDLLKGAAVDNLGRGFVIYFPSVPFEE